MASIQTKKLKGGKKSYFVVVSVQGKRKWIKAGTLREAKKLKAQIESMEKSQRVERLGISEKDIKAIEFFKQYSDHTKLHNSPNTSKRYIGVFNTFLAFLRLYKPTIRFLSQLNTQTIELYQKKRLESVRLKKEADGERNGVHKNKRLPLPQTVNFEISVLRSAFIWAKDRGYIPSIPTSKVKKLRGKFVKRTRILSVEECKVFLKSGEELARSKKDFRVYFLALKFILNTGLRSGELCNLTWDDIDLDEGLIKIQAKPGWTPKSYEREFFLNNVGLRILNEYKEKNGYIFVDSKGRHLQPDNLRRALIRIAKNAGFERFTRVHDLRHTFNSLMQMEGVDPATMGKILGHKDIETTMIYTHQTKEHLKKSIEKLRI